MKQFIAQKLQYFLIMFYETSNIKFENISLKNAQNIKSNEPITE